MIKNLVYVYTILRNQHLLVPIDNKVSAEMRKATAALWDINDQTMIDNFYTHYPTRSVNWWCDTKHVDL